MISDKTCVLTYLKYKTDNPANPFSMWQKPTTNAAT